MGHVRDDRLKIYEPFSTQLISIQPAHHVHMQQHKWICYKLKKLVTTKESVGQKHQASKNISYTGQRMHYSAHVCANYAQCSNDHDKNIVHNYAYSKCYMYLIIIIDPNAKNVRAN